MLSVLLRAFRNALIGLKVEAFRDMSDRVQMMCVRDFESEY